MILNLEVRFALIIIILLSGLSTQRACSEDFWDSNYIDYLANNFTQKYPEDQNKEIKVYKGESPLDPKYQKTSPLAQAQPLRHRCADASGEAQKYRH